MGKMWKKVWENLRESMFKKCEQNCGKVIMRNCGVEKGEFLTGFLKVLLGDLNNIFTPVKWLVFHDFHNTYNYYYK